MARFTASSRLSSRTGRSWAEQGQGARAEEQRSGQGDAGQSSHSELTSFNEEGPGEVGRVRGKNHTPRHGADGPTPFQTLDDRQKILHF